MAGKEVVQLYAAMPDAKKYNQPDIVLQAFAKTKLLQPGEEQTVTLKLKTSVLAIFDEAESAWITVPGKYKLKVGASSADMKGSVTVSVPASTRKVNNVLKPLKAQDLLKR